VITTGLTLAVLTAGGFYLIFRKLPRRVRKFMQKHVLLTDTIACLLTYLLFGGTLVALFAAAWMGVIVSILLALTSNPTTNHMLKRFAQKCGELRILFEKWVARHAPEEPKQKSELREAA